MCQFDDDNESVNLKKLNFSSLNNCIKRVQIAIHLNLTNNMSKQSQEIKDQLLEIQRTCKFFVKIFENGMIKLRDHLQSDAKKIIESENKGILENEREITALQYVCERVDPKKV